jgi:hypothetical protein
MDLVKGAMILLKKKFHDNIVNGGLAQHFFGLRRQCPFFDNHGTEKCGHNRIFWYMLRV